MSTRQFFAGALFLVALGFAAGVSPAYADKHGGGGGGGGGGYSHMGGASMSNFSANPGRIYSGNANFSHSNANFMHQNFNSGGNFSSNHGNNEAFSLHHNQTINPQFSNSMHHEWDNSFRGHDLAGRDFHRWGGYWPWYGFGVGIGLGWWDWGYGYPYGYAYERYPYYNEYCYSYAPVEYMVASVPVDSAVAVTANLPPGATEIPTELAQNAAVSEESNATESLQYYNEARDAFTRGDYRNALRLANHAGIEQPQNAKVHEMISLALFANGDYTGAATQAHFAMAMGPISDWNRLFGYYGDAEKYTAQLRALEKAVEEKPTMAAARFLLGYHYLMTGARDNAKEQFSQAAKLTPKDKLAQYVLDKLNSNSPVTPPPLTAPKQPGAAL